MARVIEFLLPCWLRDWADQGWSRGKLRRFGQRRPLLARAVQRVAFAIAERYNRDPLLCWAHLAMWAMGYDGYDLTDVNEVTPDCYWCGKCRRPPVNCRCSTLPPDEARRG